MIKRISTILVIGILFHISAQNNQWQELGNMPYPVSGGQAVALDSVIVILGGDIDSTEAILPVDFIQIYHPHSQTWEFASPLVENRYGFAAGVYADSVIVSCGGIWESSINLFSIEMWDPVNNTSQIYNHEVNFGRVNFTGHVYNDNLYMFGGLSSPALRDSVILPYLAVYNIPSASITYTFNGAYSPSFFPYHQMTAMVGEEIFIFGGTHFGVIDEIDVFNVNTRAFQYVTDLPGNRAGGKAIVYNNLVYLIGGYNENNTLSSVDIFDTSGDTLFAGPSLNYARSEMMAVNFENSIYVFGGINEYSNAVLPIERLDLITGIKKEEPQIVSDFDLRQNYPNPFNSTTKIVFDLTRKSELSLDIFTIDGQHLKNIVDESLAAGEHKYVWDAKDKNNRDVASGVYVYRLKSRNFTQTKKMILLR